MNLELVKKLHEETGFGLMECKKVLSENNEDYNLARNVLLAKSNISVSDGNKVLKNGVIASYIHHNNQNGAIVKISCETDFVSRNEEFKSFAKDIAMHITAATPICVNRDSNPKALAIITEKCLAKAKEMGKNESITEKIAKGKLDKWAKTHVLLEQQYVKDDSITINDLVSKMQTKFGEQIKIVTFQMLRIDSHPMMDDLVIEE